MPQGPIGPTQLSALIVLNLQGNASSEIRILKSDKNFTYMISTEPSPGNYFAGNRIRLILQNP
jgi:hypothetical protein